MAVKAVALALLGLLAGGPTGALAQTQTGGWCAEGIQVPQLEDDGGRPSVEILLAQAPLFSKNPKIGQKLSLVNLFHTAIILVQGARNWTLEFDSVTDVLGASLPTFQGEELLWDNDARYCLTEGVLWGQSHWTTTFQSYGFLTAGATVRIFDEFVLPLNSTAHKTKPLYQLWRVVTHGWLKSETLIEDVTCGNGVSWFLAYAEKVGLEISWRNQLRLTLTTVNADRVVPVNTSNATEWADVISYFKLMKQLVGPGETMLERWEALFSVFPVRYVYDSNSDTYYHIVGNRFPYIEAHFSIGQPYLPKWWSRPGASSAASSMLV